MMQIRIVFLVALFILTACGEQETLRPREKNHIFHTSYENNAVVLKPQVSLCENKNPSSRMFDLKLFMNGIMVQFTADFSPILSGVYLRDSKVISQTVYGEKIEYALTNRRAEILHQTKASPVMICADESKFDRESVESASLNASFYIHKTYDAFKRIAPEIKVTPVTLNISPVIIRSAMFKNADGTYRKSSLYMTDNAYYQPLTSSISFLPHSQEQKNSYYHTNFWEIPMVASHEYGHHLFQMIFQHNTTRPAHGCFGHTHQDDEGLKAIRKGATIDDVINAYNEGFADLVSWYTLNKFERNISGIKCLEISRDIGFAKFYDGKPKKFSPEALKSFFSDDLQKISRPCEFVSYQDIHTIGAVFAHATDKLLSQIGFSDEEKLAVVIEWVKFLKQERRNLKTNNARKFFIDTYAGLIRTGVEIHGSEFNRKLCKRIDDYFPELKLEECSL